MKFTLSWLQDHLDTAASLDTIVDTLTRIGLEVEDVENPAAKFAGFKVAKVLTAAPHPQADKLQVLSVDAGNGPVQVVCGAPNARAGLTGVFGLPGATVPANGMVLRVAAIRGVQSNGMMCSTRELELGDDHDGIIELPQDAPIGTDYAAYADLDDPVIDVSITPNRQDCKGVRGIARDLAAAGLGALKPLTPPTAPNSVRAEPVEALSFSSANKKGSPSTSSGQTEVGEGPTIRIEDAEGCPAFYGRTVRGVANGASPDWLARRLRAVGQKPISALVDITNYVSLDLGRPLHVYDVDTLTGGLVARTSRRDDAPFMALNNKEYGPVADAVVIADHARVLGFGGIIGGEYSGSQLETKNVVIECAYFDPDRIALTGQRLGLTTDARQRFERGVDPAFLDDGLAIATRLVVELCGGTPSAVTRAGTPPVEPRTLTYDPTLAETLGGLAVPAERQRDYLTRLGFTVADDWQVTIPSWRRDVDGPADLVEEVIRFEGIDHVPSTPLPRTPGVAKPTATNAQKLERKVRRAAAARGLDEAVTWSFIPEDQAALFGGGDWLVANPISAELKVMRPSLLPGLLSAADRNLRHGSGSVRLFELGRRYFAGQDGTSDERLTLGIVLAGDARAKGWQAGKSQGFDAYAAKAEALALLAAAGAPVDNLQVMPVPSGVEGGEAGDAYHPGQSATLRLGPKTVLAAFGIIHPIVARAFDLNGPIAAVELYLDAIPAKRGSGFMRPAYAPPALQPVTRDFAFTVPADLAADALTRAIRGSDKASIVAARVFDVFQREGEKSVAVEVTLQPGDKAFVEAELKAIADRVVAAAAKLGATLRT